MNAVERIGEFCELPQEAAPVVEDCRPPPGWPAEGRIVASDLSLKYESSPKLVVERMSFTVPARSSVGVVGRTGAGKSTLALALLRILEAHEGSLSIDGVDLSTIGLEDVRKGIAIVPQDPVLFNGTVRFNLDPFDAYDDATLRSALDRVQLTELWENQAQVQKDSKEQQQQQQHGEAEQEAKEEGQSSSSS